VKKNRRRRKERNSGTKNGVIKVFKPSLEQNQCSLCFIIWSLWEREREHYKGKKRYGDEGRVKLVKTRVF
jgi:hypothetical protein